VRLRAIHGHHLPPTLQTAQASGTMPRLSLDDAIRRKDLIQDAFENARGNQ
jgi:Nif-specific regulatory protein